MPVLALLKLVLSQNEISAKIVETLTTGGS